MMANTPAQNARNKLTIQTFYLSTLQLYMQKIVLFSYIILDLGSNHPNKTGKQQTTLNQEKKQVRFTSRSVIIIISIVDSQFKI